MIYTSCGGLSPALTLKIFEIFIRHFFALCQDRQLSKWVKRSIGIDRDGCRQVNVRTVLMQTP